MIPKRTIALTQYARAVKAGAPAAVLADARALYTAARLKEQILAALAKSPIDPDDAADLAALLLASGETDEDHRTDLLASGEGKR